MGLLPMFKHDLKCMEIILYCAFLHVQCLENLIQKIYNPLHKGFENALFEMTIVLCGLGYSLLIPNNVCNDCNSLYFVSLVRR